MTEQRILLLAGTAEARELAQILSDKGCDVKASLAGRTHDPVPYSVATRTGGFGGVDGLTSYILDQNIGTIVNATHPFATQMTANAQAAADRTGIPCLHLRRLHWQALDGDNWTHVASLEAAADALPKGAVAFLATGSGSAHIFSTRLDVRTVLRVIEQPGLSPGQKETRLVARPPYSVEHERRTFSTNGITHLVCKNSGGNAGQAKLTAARELGLPVVMVDRPAMPDSVEIYSTIEDLLARLA